MAPVWPTRRRRSSSSSTHQPQHCPCVQGLYTVAVVLMFPAMIMAMAAGAIFGLVAGTVLAWVGSSVGQTIAFVLGRWALGLLHSPSGGCPWNCGSFAAAIAPRNWSAMPPLVAGWLSGPASSLPWLPAL